jgi:hypothetical protein
MKRLMKLAAPTVHLCAKHSQNFLRYGGKSAAAAKYSRKPTAEDIRDPDWKPFDPPK